MKYWKHYCALMRKAERRTEVSGYTERHHVFPKSLFGDNKRIVVLTGREHYIAHCLLERMCAKRYGATHEKTRKMLCAHINMKSKGRYYNGRLYEAAKKKRSEAMTGENHWNWKGGKGGRGVRGETCLIRCHYLALAPTGKVFFIKSLRTFARQLGVHHSALHRVATGKQKQCYGWRLKVV